MDSTVLAYRQAQDEELLAIMGYNLKMGAKVIQRAKRSNSNVTPTGTKSWRTVGVLQGGVKTPEDLKTYRAEVGGIIKTMAIVEYGRSATISFNFIAPTLLGQSIANRSQLTIVEPTVPVTTTCDGTTLTDLKHMSIKVASVTGFDIGDNILVTTGDASAGEDVEEEPTKIKSIDTVGKVLHFEFPIFQLPTDEANVRKFVGYNQTRNIGVKPDEYQWREVSYFHTNESHEINHYPNLQQNKIIGADMSDPAKPAMYGVEGEIISTPVLNGTTGSVDSYSLYNTYTVLAPLV